MFEGMPHPMEVVRAGHLSFVLFGVADYSATLRQPSAK